MKKSLIALSIVISSASFSSCNSNMKSTEGGTLGTVEVELSYPSEYIPEMDIYLLNTDNNQTLKKRSIMNITPVIFNNVPEGNYVVYAITVEKLMSPEKGLGESDLDAPASEYVSARGGYTKSPDEWNLLPFYVSPGKNSVSINDWDVSIPE